jgi:hypothetical protein
VVRDQTPRSLAEESLTQELSGQVVNVLLVSGSPGADGDDENDDLSAFDAINDPVALTDGPDTAEAGEFADEGPCPVPRAI